MQARDVMTADVTTIAPEADVAAAAALMLERHVSGLAVVDGGGRLCGIVSEGDLLHRAEAGTERKHSWWLRMFSPTYDPAAEFIKSHGRTVADVMTRDVVTVNEATPLEEIARTLERRHIKRVPVLRGDRLVGIVSRADLLRAVATRKPDTGHAALTDDRELRERVRQAFRQADIGRSTFVNVVVTDAVVHLWGMVDSETQRKAMRVAAAEVPGVRGVEDHLAYSTPFIGV